ncbi:tRNA (5-methylaminomethyl-2-thiouridine)(34)-methyltransferase MnmD [Abyssalbus ytuae]|uniref:tRNA (5-methylaminomethyl-2-thiouridine)(34)-methyltransferase MnmD n=1 Tax=Abyssalbus ytuae TaxID=2926907 RepID=A0A9E6ZPW6_9FLAO|nr:tRNA (5-methylaminomethyl-2-thiouridine)(34)-methyltransferase MnmD [Abyssalbus ytuae]UOB18320.1 tRNA (5-methylaminomethyl-2-thiouridine)(34)-methyltransferase MnmD [Abyssalbus ytuae]
MKRKIIKTSDGSTTIFLEEWNEHYHSKHGAINEAYHVFINNGLEEFRDTSVNILEIGFGTGLNAFITLIETPKLNLTVNYEGVEAYPVVKEEINKLNYVEELKAHHKKDSFNLMHDCEWGKKVEITSYFSLKKRQHFFSEIKDLNTFDLIYFDAFGARVQPELWDKEIFLKMYNALKEKGILVTYAAKGSVRRAMQEVGFKVERLPGPPGKREMLRAIKGSY